MAEKLDVQKHGLKRFKVTGAIDIPFLILTVALMIIGLIMLFSASYPYAYYNQDGNSFYYVFRQAIFAVAGFIGMAIVSKIDTSFYARYWKIIAGVTVILLLVVLVYHTNVGGADGSDFKRWIPIGPITFQPSDLAKISLSIVLAWYFTYYAQRKVRHTLEGLIYPSGIIILTCGLIILEHHLSCTILIFLIGVSIMFAAGTNKRWFVIGIIAVAVLVFFVVSFPDLLENYAGDRIKAWLDKSYDPSGARWQTNNSLYAIGSGGFFGVGLGNSKQKYLYVSEPQNDFIFSIVCEELGFFGAALIIILFAALVIRGIYIALKCNDRFSCLLVIGICAHIGFQVILNILVVTDTLPNTGIALPFFSYGGSAIIMLLCEVGIVLSVSRKMNAQSLKNQ